LLGLGFCTLTQLSHYTKVMKVDIQKARVVFRARFRIEGSALQETVKSGPVGIEVESDDPPERVTAAVRNAENGCFVMQALVNPTEVSRQVSLNGETINIHA